MSDKLYIESCIYINNCSLTDHARALDSLLELDNTTCFLSRLPEAQLKSESIEALLDFVTEGNRQLLFGLESVNVESIKQAAKDIWDAIVKIVKSIIKRVKDFFGLNDDKEEASRKDDVEEKADVINDKADKFRKEANEADNEKWKELLEEVAETFVVAHDDLKDLLPKMKKDLKGARQATLDAEKIRFDLIAKVAKLSEELSSAGHPIALMKEIETIAAPLPKRYWYIETDKELNAELKLISDFVEDELAFVPSIFEKQVAAVTAFANIDTANVNEIKQTILAIRSMELGAWSTKRKSVRLGNFQAAFVKEELEGKRKGVNVTRIKVSGYAGKVPQSAPKPLELHLKDAQAVISDFHRLTEKCSVTANTLIRISEDIISGKYDMAKSIENMDLAAATLRNNNEKGAVGGLTDIRMVAGRLAKIITTDAHTIGYIRSLIVAMELAILRSNGFTD